MVPLGALAKRKKSVRQKFDRYSFVIELELIQENLW